MEAFRRGCTLADLTRIVAAQVEKAKEGDLGAAKWIAEGLIGRWPEYLRPEPSPLTTSESAIVYTVDPAALAAIEARDADD